MDYTYTTLHKDQAQDFSPNLNTVDEDIKWTTEGEVLKEVEIRDEITQDGERAGLSGYSVRKIGQSRQGCVGKKRSQIGTSISRAAIP